MAQVVSTIPGSQKSLKNLTPKLIKYLDGQKWELTREDFSHLKNPYAIFQVLGAISAYATARGMEVKTRLSGGKLYVHRIMK